jgi:hypothetical protein
MASNLYGAQLHLVHELLVLHKKSFESVPRPVTTDVKLFEQVMQELYDSFQAQWPPSSPLSSRRFMTDAVLRVQEKRRSLEKAEKEMETMKQAKEEAIKMKNALEDYIKAQDDLCTDHRPPAANDKKRKRSRESLDTLDTRIDAFTTLTKKIKTEQTREQQTRQQW